MKHSWRYVSVADEGMADVVNKHIWECTNCGKRETFRIDRSRRFITYLDNPDTWTGKEPRYKNQTCEEQIAESVLKQ